MKKLKKLLSLTLILTLVFSLPVQAATKKVTASVFEEGKEDYPEVKTGKYSITVNSSNDGGPEIVKFTAKKAGTYKFTVKKDKNSSMMGPRISLFKNKLPDHEAAYTTPEKPIKYKLKKGDSVYVGILMIEFGMLYDDKATLVIKKVK